MMEVGVLNVEHLCILRLLDLDQHSSKTIVLSLYDIRFLLSCTDHKLYMYSVWMLIQSLCFWKMWSKLVLQCSHDQTDKISWSHHMHKIIVKTWKGIIFQLIQDWQMHMTKLYPRSNQLTQSQTTVEITLTKLTWGFVIVLGKFSCETSKKKMWWMDR